MRVAPEALRAKAINPACGFAPRLLASSTIRQTMRKEENMQFQQDFTCTGLSGVGVESASSPRPEISGIISPESGARARQQSGIALEVTPRVTSRALPAEGSVTERRQEKSWRSASRSPESTTF